MKDIIIIGAGASGLFLGTQLDKSQSVLILEKMSRPGLKLLVSGSGACNLTHAGYISQFPQHYHAPKAFVKKVFKTFDNQDVIDYFESLGLYTYKREDGKVFPKSMQSREVLEALLGQIPHEIKYNSGVKSVEKRPDGYRVMTENECYESRSLVIATGGMSYAALGSDGSGYGLAKQLGHQMKAPHPGLTGFNLKDKPFEDLMGLSFKDVQIKRVSDGKTYKGDLLMTHFGISGPVVINNSAFFKDGDQIQIQFTEVSYEVLQEDFIRTSQKEGDKPLAFWLNQLKVPQRFKEHLIKVTGIETQKKLAEVTKEERKNILEKLGRYELVVDQLQGFKYAMVTCGGVLLEEIDPATMMSKRQDHLYFIGEVMDVDGETGGYNLQWAFSTAVQVARALSKKK